MKLLHMLSVAWIIRWLCKGRGTVSDPSSGQIALFVLPDCSLTVFRVLQVRSVLAFGYMLQALFPGKLLALFGFTVNFLEENLTTVQI